MLDGKTLIAGVAGIASVAGLVYVIVHNAGVKQDARDDRQEAMVLDMGKEQTVLMREVSEIKQQVANTRFIQDKILDGIVSTNSRLEAQIAVGAQISAVLSRIKGRMDITTDSRGKR